MALTQTFIDNFDDNSIGDWTGYNSIAETGGQLVASLTGATPDYHGIYSDNTYDLTGSYVQVEVVNAGNQSWTSIEVEMQMQDGGSGARRLLLDIGGGDLIAYNTVGGTTTNLASITYNSTTMRWLRIREDSGTIYWEYTSTVGYAADTWTTLHSKATPIPITNLQFELDAGNWDTETGTTTVIFDNFNVVPPTVDVTKSAPYAVLYTPSDITKSAPYEIAVGGDITKDSGYSVLYTPSDITKTSGYETASISATDITKTSGYSILLSTTDITKDSGYSIGGQSLDSSRLKKLKIGEKYGPVTSVILGRVPQNDNIVIANLAPESATISSIDTGTDLFTVTANAMVDGNLVRIESDGDIPAPLQANVNYYVYTNGDPDTFALTYTYADAIAGTNLIDITTSGTGTITLSRLQTQEVQINNNQIVDDDRETLLPDLYAELVGIEWWEVEATTIGLGWYEVGDLVEFVQGSTSVIGFISEVHLTFDGSIKERIVSKIPDVATINYQTAGGIIKTIYNTEIKVDKQENDITSIVSTQDVYQNETVENFTQLYQDIASILLTVQTSGGGNLIRNSVGFATTAETDASTVSYDKFSFWDYNASYDTATNGVVSSSSSSESQNNGGVSGQAIEFVGADITLTQRVAVAANTELSFGVRVNNAIGTGDATITLSNDNETFTINIDSATAYEWTELSLEDFSTTLPWLDVEIAMNAVSSLQMTDLRIMYGATLTGWMQSSSEILSTNVQFTELGMKIFDNVHDTETQVTYNEFSTRRRSDGAILFEADDTGVVARDVTIKGHTSYFHEDDEVIRQITIPESSNLAGIAFIRVS